MVLQKILSNILIAITLLAGCAETATASPIAENHSKNILPLKSELLDKPVNLKDCPVDIIEWRGEHPLDPTRMEKLNDYCKLVIEKFDLFIDSKGIKKYNIIPFGDEWKASIIPESSNYRNLNDSKYRFHKRGKQHAFYWGYTSNESQHIFIADESTIDIWAHELFHAMSFHYFIYINHADNYNDRTKIDEKLAIEFTKWLGLT